MLSELCLLLIAVILLHTVHTMLVIHMYVYLNLAEFTVTL